MSAGRTSVRINSCLMALSNDDLRLMQRSLQESQRRLKSVARSPRISELIRQSAEAQKRLTSSPGITELIRQAARAFREWDESERRVLALLVPRGWLISPSTTLTETHELLAVADADGADAAEERLVTALTPARCRGIVEELYDRPSFAAWRDVFDQALAAHEQGSYSLTVPIWLLAFDGIFFSELQVDNVFTKVQRRKGSVVRSMFTEARDRSIDALVGVILTVAEHLPHGAQPSGGALRRHVVLHGLDPSFGTAKASIQGILLLEALHFQLELQHPLPDPGTISSAT